MYVLPSLHVFSSRHRLNSKKTPVNLYVQGKLHKANKYETELRIGLLFT